MMFLVKRHLFLIYGRRLPCQNCATGRSNAGLFNLIREKGLRMEGLGGFASNLTNEKREREKFIKFIK